MYRSTFIFFLFTLCFHTPSNAIPGAASDTTSGGLTQGELAPPLLVPRVQPLDQCGAEPQLVESLMQQLWEKYPTPDAIILSDADVFATKPEKSAAQFKADCDSVLGFLNTHRDLVRPVYIGHVKSIQQTILNLYDENKISAIHMNAAYVAFSMVITDVQLIKYHKDISQSQDVAIRSSTFLEDLPDQLDWLLQFIQAANPIAMLDLETPVFDPDPNGGYLYQKENGDVVTHAKGSCERDLATFLDRFKSAKFIMQRFYRLNQLGIFPETRIHNGGYASYQDLVEFAARGRPLIECGINLLSVDGTDPLATASSMFNHDLQHVYLNNDTLIFEERMALSPLTILYKLINKMSPHVDFKNPMHGFVSSFILHEALGVSAHVQGHDNFIDELPTGTNARVIPNPDALTPFAFREICSSSFYELPSRFFARNSDKKALFQLIRGGNLPKSRPVTSGEIHDAFPDYGGKTLETLYYREYNQLFEIVAALKKAGHDIELWTGDDVNLEKINDLMDTAIADFINNVGCKMFGSDFETVSQDQK